MLMARSCHTDFEHPPIAATPKRTLTGVASSAEGQQMGNAAAVSAQRAWQWVLSSRPRNLRWLPLFRRFCYLKVSVPCAPGGYGVLLAWLANLRLLLQPYWCWGWLEQWLQVVSSAWAETCLVSVNGLDGQVPHPPNLPCAGRLMPYRRLSYHCSNK